MPDTSSTTTFRADISSLRAEMQAASRAVRVANSEFKAATAGMDDWGSSADGLEAKIKQLQSVLSAQNKQVALAADELSKVEAEYGQNSAEADRARVSYNNFQAAAAKTEKELSQYQKKLDDVSDETKQMDQATDTAGKGLKGFGDVAKIAMGNLAAEAVQKFASMVSDGAKALVEAGVAAASYADEMLTASQVTGMSTDTLQEYRYAAELIDTDLEDVEKALAKNVKSMASAQSGSKAYAQAYKELGIEVEDSNGNLRDSETVFWEAIDALGNMENKTKADAIAMQLFGRSARELNPLIKTGSEGFRALAEEAHEAGAVLSESTLNSLGEVDDSIQRLNSQTAAFKTVLGAGIAPILGTLADGATAALKAFTNFFSAPETSDLEDYLEDLDGRIEDTKSQIDNLGSVELKADADVSSIETYREVLEKATQGEELSEFEKYQLKRAVEELGGVIPGLAEAYDTETSSINLTKEALDELLDSTIKQIKMDAYSDAIEQAYKAAADAAVEATEAQSAYEAATNDLSDALDKVPQEVLDTWDLDNMDPTVIYDTAAAYGVNAKELMDLISAQQQAKTSMDEANAAQKKAEDAAEQRVAAIEKLQKEEEEAADSEKNYAKATGGSTEAELEHVEIEDMSIGVMGSAAKASAKSAKEKKKKTKASEEAAEAEKEEAKQADLLTDALGNVVKFGQDHSDVVTDFFEKAGEAAMDSINEKIERAMEIERNALETTRQAYLDNYNTVKQTISNKISLWDSFSGGEDITVEKMLENLQNQTAGIEQYKDEMAAVIAEYGDELGPDLVNTLQSMGTDAANTWHHMFVTMSQDNAPQLFADMGKEWAKGLDLSDQIAKYMAGTLTAYQVATGKMGSTKVEWTGLRESINEMTPELDAAITAAENAGVEIPDGLADGLRSGEITATDAVQMLEKSLQGTFQGLYEIAEQSGVDIPEGLSKGMEGSAEEYQAAINTLTESLSQAGNDAGTAAAEEISTGLSDNTDSVETAAEDTASSAATAADNASSDFEKAGSSSGTQYVKGIRSKTAQAKSAGTALANNAKSGASGVDMTQSGVHFAQGYINGINSLVGAVAAKAREMVRNAINAAKAEQQEGSPSKLTYQSGKYFTQGYINGIASEQKRLVKTVQGLVGAAIKELSKVSGYDFGSAGEKAMSTFSSTLDTQIDYLVGKFSYQNQQKLDEFETEITRLETERDGITARLQAASDKKQNAIQKKLDKAKKSKTKKKYKEQLAAEKAAVKSQIQGVENQYENLIKTQEKYESAYNTASSEMLNQLQDALSNYRKSAEDLVESAITSITDTYDERYSALIDKQDNLVAKLREAADLFEVGSSGVMIIGDVTEQTKQIREYTQKLQGIKKKVSAELFDQITQYDMKEGAAFTDYLLNMTAEELDAYNAAYTDKLLAASEAAESIYGQDIKDVAADYQKEILTAFDDLPAQLEDLGMQALKGFIDGFSLNTDYMTTEIKTFVKGMIDQFKSQLQIHSPSRVTFSLGEYTGEGFVDGVMSLMRRAKAAASELASAVSSPLDGISGEIGSFRAAAPLSAYGPGAGGVVNNYNLVQNNNSPKSLSALETYQARRRQIALVKAFAS